jgi:hypothetical protein
VGVQLPELLSRADYASDSIKTSLEAAFESSPTFDRNPEMERQWSDIGAALMSELQRAPLDDVLYFETSLRAFERALKQVSDFEARHSGFLGAPMTHQISIHKNVLKYHEKFSRHTLWFYRKYRILKDSEKQLSHIRDWLKRLCDDVLSFLQEREFPGYFISSVIVSYEIFSGPEIFNMLRKTQYKGIKNKAIFDGILIDIEYYISEINHICTVLRSLEPLIPFEVNGEVIHLSPDSAEGKALKRLESMRSGEEVEWELIEPDHELDMRVVREKIKARGYKVSTESSP